MKAIAFFFFLTLLTVACKNEKEEKQKEIPLVKNLAAESIEEKVSPADSMMGSQVFLSSCSSCHTGSRSLQAPSQAVLRTMTTYSIFAALTNGRMREQAKNLTEVQRK